MKTVLVIDDDAGVREGLLEILALEGYSTLEAENGKIGFEQVLTHHPSLIICDYNMPEMKGDEVLCEIRNLPELVSIPFIIYSSMTTPELREKCLQLGANEYLSKLTPLPNLLAIIFSYLS